MIVVEGMNELSNVSEWTATRTKDLKDGKHSKDATLKITLQPKEAS